MIRTIAGFESRSLFRAPQTWIVAAVMALLFGFLFLQTLESYLVAQPQLALQDHPIGLSGYLAVRYQAALVMVFALVAPLFAMRSFSEEYRQQTLALWQSSPVTNTALVIGKYLGVMWPLLLLALLSFALPLSMLAFTSLDAGVVFSSALGLVLAMALFAAIGLYFSSLTQHALLAVAATVMSIALLWLLGSTASAGVAKTLLQTVALPTHLNGFFQGFIALEHILYFLVLIALFISLTVVRLDALRRNGL